MRHPHGHPAAPAVDPLEADRLPLRSPAPNTIIAGVAVVRKREARPLADGRPSLVIEVGNASGAIGGRVWAEGIAAWEGIAAGDAVHVRGRTKPGYQGGGVEIVVDTVERLGDDHPVRLEINPRCPRPLQELKERFAVLASFLRPGARALLDAVIAHVGEELYYEAPAAKSMHDACIGGLAHHSIKVAETALLLAVGAEADGDLWVDLVIVGALLHDIGKVNEYQWRGCAIDVSDRYHLVSHVCSGSLMVQQAVQEHADALREAGTTEEEILHLVHVITSHHGTLEWGSPTPPATLAAQLIHQADSACARLASLTRDLDSTPPDPVNGWSRPTGYRRNPIWAPQVAGARTDLLAQGNTGRAPVRAAARAVLGTRSTAGEGATRAQATHVTVPHLSERVAAALAHSVWQAAERWDEATRTRRRAVLAVADHLVHQVSRETQALLEPLRRTAAAR